jgi:hypothetical protein
LFVWDIEDVSKIHSYRSFLFHSGPIWDIQVVDGSSLSSAPVEAGDHDTHDTDGTNL